MVYEYKCLYMLVDSMYRFYVIAICVYDDIHNVHFEIKRQQTLQRCIPKAKAKNSSHIIGKKQQQQRIFDDNGMKMEKE